MKIYKEINEKIVNVFKILISDIEEKEKIQIKRKNQETSQYDFNKYTYIFFQITGFNQKGLGENRTETIDEKLYNIYSIYKEYNIEVDILGIEAGEIMNHISDNLYDDDLHNQAFYCQKLALKKGIDNIINLTELENGARLERYNFNFTIGQFEEVKKCINYIEEIKVDYYNDNNLITKKTYKKG